MSKKKKLERRKAQRESQKRSLPKSFEPKKKGWKQ